MTDRERTHLINSFERSIPHAENGLISVSVDAAKEIIALLKEQEEQTRQLTEELEELRNKRNEVYYSGYDGSFIL